MHINNENIFLYIFFLYIFTSVKQSTLLFL